MLAPEVTSKQEGRPVRQTIYIMFFSLPLPLFRCPNRRKVGIGTDSDWRMLGTADPSYRNSCEVASVALHQDFDFWV
jgi:hypothetical protein